MGSTTRSFAASGPQITAFLASVISIFSGAQLFALGIFGDYLARMHFRNMDRPPELIGEIAALSESDEIVTETASGPIQENGIV